MKRKKSPSDKSSCFSAIFAVNIRQVVLILVSLETHLLLRLCVMCVMMQRETAQKEEKVLLVTACNPVGPSSLLH